MEVTFKTILLVALFHTEMHATDSILSESSFCQTSTRDQIKNFPSSNQDSRLPWIWDATYDPTKAIVELAAVSRRACSFNVSEWKTVHDSHPKYGSQLGYGTGSNILVNPARLSKTEFEFLPHSDSIQTVKVHLNCVFYQNRTMLQKVRAVKIKTHHHADMGTIQIFCATPRKTWNRMKLERGMYNKELSMFEYLRTEALPVCRLPDYQPLNKRYKLSVSIATMGTNRVELVEWIEYHILQGVNHFYIYHTATQASQQQQVHEAFHDYIHEGVVTVIPWPYQNCVRGMASGRWVHYYLPNQNRHTENGHFFNPPRAIAQSAALASCYSRFKHTSSYITHIDTDEFLFHNHNRSVSSGSSRSSGANSGTPYESIAAYADRIFTEYPTAPAIYFQPLFLAQCPDTSASGLQSNSRNQLLPRVGTWNSLRAAVIPYEGKLLMRTDAVDMFVIHYLTQFSDSAQWRAVDKFTPHISEAALLHYKVTPNEAGSVYGGTLPLSEDRQFNTNEKCFESLWYPLVTMGKGGNDSSSSGEAGDQKDAANEKTWLKIPDFRKVNIRKLIDGVKYHSLASEFHDNLVTSCKNRMYV